MHYCHVGMNDACMYGRMHSRVAYVYVCTIARMHVYTHASVMYVWTYLCMHADAYKYAYKNVP